MTPIIDATIRHSIYLERYKARLIKDILAKLKGIENGVYTAVSEADLERLSRKQLGALLRDVQSYIKTGYAPILEDVEGSLKELAAYEGQWSADSVVRAGIVTRLAVPSDADLWAAMYSRPFQGKLLREWLTDLPVNAARRVREAIRQGYVEGKSGIEIARALRGTRSQSGVMQISARGAEAMVRTAVSHTANAARERTFAQNDTIRYVQWVSVLDGRTTAICRGRDGAFYDAGKGPRPPAHVGCRSTVIPATGRNRRRLEDRETYDQWLRRQPIAVQEDILGIKKAKLFREGLTLDKFVDKSGNEYTLDQLKAADASIWSKAFGE